MKPRLLLVVLLPLCLVLSARADDKNDQKDLETGLWKVTAINQAGKDAPRDFVVKSDLKYTFKGDKLTIASGGETKEGTFKLDSSKKPKELDVKMQTFDDKGIYEISGDTLKIAIGKSDRPKDFAGGADIVVFTLERQK